MRRGSRTPSTVAGTRSRQVFNMGHFALPVRVVEGSAGGGLDVLEIGIDFTVSVDMGAGTIGDWKLTVRNADKIFNAFDDIIAHPGQVFAYKMYQDQQITISAGGQSMTNPSFDLNEIECFNRGFNPELERIGIKVCTAPAYIDSSSSAFPKIFDVAFSMLSIDDGYCDITISLIIMDPDSPEQFDIQMQRSALDEDGTFYYSETSE